MQDDARQIDVKSIRKSLKLSQTDFGKKIGASLRSVQMYEKGSTKPSADVLLKILELDIQINSQNKYIQGFSSNAINEYETKKEKEGTLEDILFNRLFDKIRAYIDTKIKDDIETAEERIMMLLKQTAAPDFKKKKKD